MTNQLKNKKHFMVVGANHRSSTMVFRDKLTIGDSQLEQVNDRLLNVGISQSLVVSTTDRIEVYVCHDPLTDPSLEIIKLLSAHAGIGRAEIEAQTYVLTNSEAIRHLLAVCCALDSLVLGDPHIRDVLTLSYGRACQAGMSGIDLDFLINKAFAVSDRVLRETEISRSPVSIPAAAAQVARDLHGDLAQCAALLIGAGEMGEMLAISLLSAGLSHLVVTHPIIAKAEALGQQLNCHIGHMEELLQLLAKSDIVLTSMNSRRFSLSRDAVKAATAMRRRKPILFIDAGVPGDIDHTAEELEDAFIYSLDDLERVTREGSESREVGAGKAWKIVDEEANHLSFSLRDTFNVNEKRVSTGSIEKLRKKAVTDSLGDADKATRLLLHNLQRYGNNLAGLLEDEQEDMD